MEYIKNAQEFLKGRKTYIISTLLVLASLTGVISGDVTVANFLNSNDLWILLNGLGLGSLRAGLTKISK